MPTPYFADLVREFAQDGGTGPLTPTGAVPGHRRFAGAVPPATPFHYAVAGVGQPGQWEAGLGRIDANGRLQRDTVAASSNAGLPVDFAPGLKTIALTVGAGWFAASDTAAAATAGALAAKQPLSTTHADAESGASDDRLTVRRGDGWVNVPLTAIAWRDVAGRYQVDGPIAASGGSAAAPAIGFAADGDTGLFRAAADCLALATGGSERLRIDAAGNVGIGMVPANRFDVQTSAGRFSVAGAGAASVRLGGSAGLDYDVAAGSAHRFLAAGAQVAVIDGAGMRVGATAALAGERLTVFAATDGGPSLLSRFDAGTNKPHLMVRHLDAGGRSRIDASAASGAASLSLAIGNVDALLIDNSRKVGIGTAAPISELDVVGAVAGVCHATTADNLSSKVARYYGRSYNNGLVGGLVAGLVIDATETVNNVRIGGGTPTASAATNIIFMTGGSVGVASGTDRWMISWTGTFRPSADNLYAFGQANMRPTQLLAATGTVNTSDAREKAWRGPPAAAELAAARRIVGELGFYQWNDAVARKGPDGARMHFGVRAQMVWAIMADEGLIAPIAEGVKPDSRYAFLCHDEWDEERDDAGDIVLARGNRFGIRPDELALFLIAAQAARLAALEAAA